MPMSRIKSIHNLGACQWRHHKTNSGDSILDHIHECRHTSHVSRRTQWILQVVSVVFGQMNMVWHVGVLGRGVRTTLAQEAQPNCFEKIPLSFLERPQALEGR